MNAPCFDSDELVKEHGDFLFRCAVKKLGDRFVAEDMVQETLITAISKSSSLRGESSLRTWLVTILNNKIIDHIRKFSRESLLSENEDELPEIFNSIGAWSSWVFKRWEVCPESAIDNARFKSAITSCVAKLPTKSRAIFLARHRDDWDSLQICKELQITQANLDTCMFRARLLVRECLEKNWFKIQREAA